MDRTELRDSPVYEPRHAPGARGAVPGAVGALRDWARGLTPARRRRALLLAGPLLAIGLGFRLYLAGGRYVSTDNAYVQADTVALSTDVAGPVIEVQVHENQAVEQGQLLFRIDPEPYQIAVVAAEAQLDGARAEIRSLQADYRRALAEIRQAEADLAFSERELGRERDLAAKSVASRAGLDKVRHDAESAHQHLDALHEQAQVALAKLGGNAELPPESYARFRGAQAQADKARRDLRRTQVTAPMAGVVANTDRLQVGQYLMAAQPACSLVARDHVWVEANPKETDLTYLATQNPASITVDAYPGREWKGAVASLSPATGAEFSVLPSQNVSGNWVKVVQRVPVRLRVEQPPDGPPLRAGMSVQVRIDTGHRRSLAELARGVGRWVGL